MSPECRIEQWKTISKCYLCAINIEEPFFSIYPGLIHHVALPYKVDVRHVNMSEGHLFSGRGGGGGGAVIRFFYYMGTGQFFMQGSRVFDFVYVSVCGLVCRPVSNACLYAK